MSYVINPLLKLMQSTFCVTIFTLWKTYVTVTLRKNGVFKNMYIDLIEIVERGYLLSSTINLPLWSLSTNLNFYNFKSYMVTDMRTWPCIKLISVNLKQISGVCILKLSEHVALARYMDLDYALWTLILIIIIINTIFNWTHMRSSLEL